MAPHQAEGALAGTGAERRVQRCQPTTRGRYARPETAAKRGEGRMGERLRRAGVPRRHQGVLRARRRHRVAGLLRRAGARGGVERVSGRAAQLRETGRRRVPDETPPRRQRRPGDADREGLGVFVDVRRLWVRVRDRRLLRLRPTARHDATDGRRDRANGPAIVPARSSVRAGSSPRVWGRRGR